MQVINKVGALVDDFNEVVDNAITISETVNFDPEATCELCSEPIFTFEEKHELGLGAIAHASCFAQLPVEEQSLIKLENRR